METHSLLLAAAILVSADAAGSAINMSAAIVRGQPVMAALFWFSAAVGIYFALLFWSAA